MKGIVILTAQSVSGRLVTHYLKQHIPVLAVIQEEKESRKVFLKRRLKKIGWWKLFGQLSFMMLVPRLLKSSSAKRISEIKKQYDLNFESLSGLTVHQVRSVNTDETRKALEKYDPDLVLVIGTRIIGKKTLSAISSPFINIHVGLTPYFRGVHGGYWALVMREKFGTTIHWIDEGIDTGRVIKQKISTPTSKDNFLTYPYLQMAEILEPLRDVVKSYLDSNLQEEDAIYTESRIWSHPTLREYIFNYLKRGVK